MHGEQKKLCKGITLRFYTSKKPNAIGKKGKWMNAHSPGEAEHIKVTMYKLEAAARLFT